MELPRDIIERFGLPVLTSFTYSNGVQQVAKASYDRWFLGFMFDTGPNQLLRPSSTDGQTHARFNTGTDTFILMHQLTHGLMVNLAWETDVAFMGGLITTIECFARKAQVSTVDLNIPLGSIPSRKRLSPTPTAKVFVSGKRLMKR